jgi:ectoine hydroxylase-related dioxygenase (phytanoyl-CoA dioxygenase family)
MNTEYPSFIAEHGYAIVPNVFGNEEFCSLTERLCRTDVTRSRAGIRHTMKYQEVARLAQDPRLTSLACRALSGTAFPYRATLFDKSPTANWLIVWHQDTALPIRERHNVAGWGPWSVKENVIYAHAPASALARVVALRIHLDNSTEHNGPLRVLPGTHRSGVLTDDQLQQLGQHTSPIECTVACGGVVAMRPLIVHSSAKSRVNAPRRVLHIEYAAEMSIAKGLELAIA